MDDFKGYVSRHAASLKYMFDIKPLQHPQHFITHILAAARCRFTTLPTPAIHGCGFVQENY